MSNPEIDLKALDDDRLKHLIENHRTKHATDKKIYIDALEEQARRKGKGLDFKTTMRVIKKAAAEKRYLSYGKLAAASGADWNRVPMPLVHIWTVSWSIVTETASLCSQRSSSINRIYNRVISSPSH
jgi:hypothetical protein